MIVCMIIVGRKDKNMRSVFMNGRHFKLLFLLTMRYALGIPPNLRTNIDYVFILRENYVSNRKRLYEHYAGMFPTFEMFCQVMDQCTENYECLVINNNAKSNKLSDQVFWYKAEPRPDFKIGDNFIGIILIKTIQIKEVVMEWRQQNLLKILLMFKNYINFYLVGREKYLRPFLYWDQLMV